MVLPGLPRSKALPGPLPSAAPSTKPMGPPPAPSAAPKPKAKPTRQVHSYLDRVFINGAISLQWVLANPTAFFLVDAGCEAFDNGQLVRQCGRGFAACVKRQLAGSTLE